MPSTTPFRLKWAGGKRWLADALCIGLPRSNLEGGVCEPFAGGAALTFASLPKRPHLNDTNLDLIATYRALRDQPDAIARGLSRLTIDAQTFERLRAEVPGDDVERAVRVIYLNRTAFNGLWRVNRAGQYNVPFGCKPETSLPSVAPLRATSDVLKDAVLDNQDFEVTCANTAAQTVYLDPPYTVTHNRNGFIRYNEHLFSWADQQRLVSTAQRMSNEGRTVLVSNAMHSEVMRLYSQIGFRLYRVRRVNNLAASVRARGAVHELLAVSPSVRFTRLPPFATRIAYPGRH